MVNAWAMHEDGSRYDHIPPGMRQALMTHSPGYGGIEGKPAER